MKRMIVAMMIVACTASGLFAGGAEIGERVSEEPMALCTITIKGTYDGKTVDLKVTLEAANCAVAAGELLKTVIAKK